MNFGGLDLDLETGAQDPMVLDHGQDGPHKNHDHGKGGVTVYADALQTSADFEVGPGPKYHVYLVPDANVTPDTAVDATMYVDLGRLRAFKGSQVFNIPAGLDLKTYKSVVIWCEQFGVLISPAALSFK